MKLKILILLLGLCFVACSEQEPGAEEQQQASFLFVQDEMILDGENLEKLCVRDARGGLEVILVFSKKGRETLHTLTGNHIDQMLVLTNFDTVYLSTIIRDQISGGRVNLFVEREANKTKQDIENFFKIQASETC